MRNQADSAPRKVEVATLGGGCFWCTEAVFSRIKGVHAVEPGYSGGNVANPTYEQASAGTTGHAEVVQVTYDPDVISFREVLEVFFTTHDPTTLNRQGNDVGTQYRSVIFYRNQGQKSVAEKLIDELRREGAYDTAIVTAVEPFKAFFKAEEYHKNYFALHPNRSYCQLVISPKIAKLRRKHRTMLKEP
jgi:peptide-methionine (S)-S-oxide reductase